MKLAVALPRYRSAAFTVPPGIVSIEIDPTNGSGGAKEPLMKRLNASSSDARAGRFAHSPENRARLFARAERL